MYGVQGTSAYNFCLSDPYTQSSSIPGSFANQLAFNLNPGYKANAAVVNTGYTSAWS